MHTQGGDMNRSSSLAMKMVGGRITIGGRPPKLETKRDSIGWV